MKYVFDTSSLSNVLRHYYRDRFPSFWQKYNQMISEKQVVSVREVRFELSERFDDTIINQIREYNPDFFEDPTTEELNFVKEIYSIAHFRQNLEKKKLLQGGYFADPFIIVKAKIMVAAVVSES
jgi:hypothetical protein